MKLLKFEEWQIALLDKIAERTEQKVVCHSATNKDIIQSVIETCKQYHSDCEVCPYWLKNKFACIWYAHKIIGSDVMSYWDENEIEEIPV